MLLNILKGQTKQAYCEKGNLVKFSKQLKQVQQNNSEKSVSNLEDKNTN
jgi:hypothetical protein